MTKVLNAELTCIHKHTILTTPSTHKNTLLYPKDQLTFLIFRIRILKGAKKVGVGNMTIVPSFNSDQLYADQMLRIPFASFLTFCISYPENSMESL